jgi:hypothetical protein
METFYWTTEEYHPDNNFTMQDYLNNHLPEKWELFFEDGTYAEIRNKLTGTFYGVHASGNGDSFNHKVEFVFIH